MHKGEIDIALLGCSKNLVDAERLMRRLEAFGYHTMADSPSPQGEIAIINTCGFIGDAKEESINTILSFAERKRRGLLKKLYVMGCLSERYLKELQGELPEVDRFFGKFDFMGIVDELKSISKSTTITRDFERILTTPSHYAYFKIAEGCNRFCSYCAIPLITGRYKSRPMQDLVAEAEWLAKQGVKELQVIAQDLTGYGQDLYHENKIAELVERLSDVKGIEWIRLHYAYPTHFPMELLRVMRERENVCKYLDIALQHSTDHMLSLMRRHITAEEQNNLIQHIREEVPGIHLRTTLLLGHPGETQSDFEQLLEWVSRMRFERLGAFAYSDEEGTYAHEHYKDDIPQQVKEQRVEQLMTLQETIAAELNQHKVGKIMRVIIDREEPDYFVGRTEYDSPEVDGEVLIKKTETYQTGDFYNVKIQQADTFDLYG